ncbi:Ankyrin-3 [Talaromyces pinophilus]|nr:Ankyrin-3 [Talaromyces pinophilus]
MAGQKYAHKDYTIGWICALPKTEFAAAAAMLDEEHPILPAADPNDANSYLLGRIGDHNVVIACMPAETTGKVSAATVATDLIRSFPSIRFGLMVGIGGGVPYQESQRQDMSTGIDDDKSVDSEDWMDEKPDIRLGDVVVSLHTKTTEAVVQYDFGKSLQAKGFVHAGGKLNKPPHIVLNAIARLQANHARGHHRIPELLLEMHAANPAMANFQHPGCEKDRLFRADFAYLEGKRSCKACCGPDNANLVMRSDRTDTAPKIHYGTIGSADQVMKDAILRDQWALKESILYFEMEAAGLMDTFPCLIIRGICDYADSHKTKAWQPYAAATAAAYTKELLLVIPGQGLAKLSPIKQILHLSEQVEAVNSGLEKAFKQRENHHHERVMRYRTEDQRQCHQVFKTSTYERFKNINPNRVEGTCEWVLKSPEYLRWWDTTSNDLLWISADPGCGKSVLAKSLVDDNDEQNNLTTALCAILHQLFSLQPQLLRHTLPSWQRNKEKIQYEVEDMWRIFTAAASDLAFANTICVFDALDECRDHDQKHLIDRLWEFHDRHPISQESWLKFLVTSRSYGDIQDCFRPVTESFPQIYLRGEEENDQIHKEINLVVKVKLAELRKDLGLRADTQERLERELCEMQHRTYLWLYLAIDGIKVTLKHSLRPDRETIPQLPKNVPEAYERILDRVPSDQKTKVETILRIIVGARRPLTVQEMAMALGVATTPGAETATEARLSLNGLDKRIRQLCGLFVFIKESKIYLIHQTAREFLISKHNRSANIHWHLGRRKTEIQMTKICVKYLLMSDLVSNDGESVRSLLDYSAENWAYHFRDVRAPDDELVSLVWKLYDVSTERFRLWFGIFWDVAMPYRRDPRMKALHLAAFNGHPEILCRVDVNEIGGIDLVDNSGETALRWASERAHLEIVQLLLEKGADVDARGGKYGTALQAAVEKGHVEIVRLLLKKGADVNTQKGPYYHNALQAAARDGHVEIVWLLLEKGADINIPKGPYYCNALQDAAEKGYLEIVRLLLGKGADVDARGGDDYGTALQAAAGEGHLEIVWLLLKKGADVHAQGGDYGTALQVAALGGHVEIIQLLLDKVADVDALGGDYGNALQDAARGGHVEIVRLLLEKGADVNTQKGPYYLHALQDAAERGHLEIVRLLLEKGVGIITRGVRFNIRGMLVGIRGGYYDTALQAAAGEGHLEIVQLLLEKGVDVNTQGGRYGCGLQYAARGGHLEIIQLLLDKVADVDALGGDYGSALRDAARGGHVEIIQLLLDKVVDFNTQKGLYYRNALQAAAGEGHLEIVQLLLEKGADIHARGVEYASALQAAAGEGHLEIVRLLLEKGADVHARGGGYGTALQAAAGEGHVGIVQLLLEEGVNVNTHGGEYGYGLQDAARGGHLEIVRLLLEKGADVNTQKGPYYHNALQVAALGGHLDVVQLLRKKDAHVRAPGGEYGSALQVAAGEGHLEIVRLLLEKGADVHAQGGDYGTALQAAAGKGHLETVRLLLAKGADVNAQSEYYGNAFYAAADGGYLKIVQLLLEKGADVNVHGGYYGNALQTASMKGYFNIVHILIEKGADVNAQGGEYGNALQAAYYHGYLDIVHILIEKGADVNAQGGKYGNALQAATTKGHHGMIDILQNAN